MRTKKIICYLCFICFYSCILIYKPLKLQAQAKNIKDLEAEVDTYIQLYVEGGNFSGSVLVAQRGEILLCKSYGMANYEHNIPNTSETKFHLASVSKPFTAAAILLLEEKGLLSVQDPLTKFIPDYPRGGEIAIHNLLVHNSGVKNVNVFGNYDRESKFPQTPEKLVKLFKDKPLDFNPGEKYSYSNSNYNLLAFIIEKVSGKNYGEFLKENIFDRLNMKDTGHDGDATAIIKNVASGYTPHGLSSVKKVPYLDWSIKTGNGSLYSTVLDLYKWDRALYTEKLLKKNTLRKMFTKHVDGAVGYGWFLRKRFKRDAVYINGRSPGFSTYLLRFPEDDVCIIVLGNNYAPVATNMGLDIAAMLFSEDYELPRITPVKVDPDELDKYTGSFRFGPSYVAPNHLVQFVKKNNQLYIREGGRAESELLLIPVGDMVFFHRGYWTTVVFEKDDTGKVVRVFYPYFPDQKAKRIQ